MQATPRSGQVFSRIVVPLILFIVVVAGVAWLIQYLPQIGEKPVDETASDKQNMLKFEREQTAWPRNGAAMNDPQETEYLKEFEPGEEGHYDYPFENITDNEVEVIFDKASCTCTRVSIKLIPSGTISEDVSKLDWIPLKRPEKQGTSSNVVVPVGGKGIVRLGWGTAADKQENKLGKKAMSTDLWIQAKGKEQSRKKQTLKATIFLVPALYFQPDQVVDLGNFPRAARRELICWSATRDIRSALQIDAKQVEPGFLFELTPLSDEDLTKFQSDLKASKVPLQAKSAVHIEVQAFAEIRRGFWGKTTESLQRGPFVPVKKLPLLLDGSPYALGPSISGKIQPAVVFDGCETGKIQLGTFTQEGIKKVYFARVSPSQSMLTLAHSPANMNVNLTIHPDAGTMRWRLQIDVPRNTSHFPVDNMIILRSQPTEYYLGNIASTLGNLGGPVHSGSLPSIANFSSLMTSSGAGVQQDGIPITGEVTSN